MTVAVEAAAIRCVTRADARPTLTNGTNGINGINGYIYSIHQHGVCRRFGRHTLHQRTVCQLGKPEKVFVACNLISISCFVRLAGIVAGCAAAVMVVIVTFHTVNLGAAQYLVSVRTECLPPLGRGGGVTAVCGKLISDRAVCELRLCCNCFVGFRNDLSKPIAVGGCSVIIGI